jgi:hypothetical protein
MHYLQAPNNSFNYGLRTEIPSPARTKVLSVVVISRIASGALSFYALALLISKSFYSVTVYMLERYEMYRKLWY